MNRSSKFSILLACAPCFANTSGAVSDPFGNALAGVKVSLVLAGTSTTTDVKGAWTLGMTGMRKPDVSKAGFCWIGNAVELNLADPSIVSVEAYDLRGDLLERLPSVRLGAGPHRLPLKLVSSGMVKLRVLVNGKVEVMLAGFGDLSRYAAPIQIAARSQRVVDTLRFTWNSKVVTRIPLTNLDTSGILIRIDTVRGIALHISTIYGKFTDSRDGQEYLTTKIGSQTWMAQNLNYTSPIYGVGWCYSDSDENCAKYGRLYTWSDMMQGSASSTKVPSGVQGICPSNWHIPSDTEWSILVSTVEANPLVGFPNSGLALKSLDGWTTYLTNGADVVGFDALPSGYRTSKFAKFPGSYNDLGEGGYYWSSTQYDASFVWYRYFNPYTPMLRNIIENTYAYSVRCLADHDLAPTPHLDSMLIGNWSRHIVVYNDDDTYTLSLSDDGSYSSTSVFRTPSYTDRFQDDGIWSTAGDTLFMQHTGKAQGLSNYSVDAVHLHIAGLDGSDTMTYYRQ